MINWCLTPYRSKGYALTQAILIAATISIFLFVLQGNIDINLADEGFLWYGTIRTTLGDIPLRDFQSYDPGRYLWSALWFKVTSNNSLMTLRLSTTLFQIVGLTCGLLSLQRVTHSWSLLTIIGFILALWMFPRHKLFEPTIAMIAVFMAVLLLEKPSFRRHFTCGLLVGLAAFFGRNHGLYLFISFALLIFFNWLKFGGKFLKRIAFWSMGILIGYTPMFFMLAIIPGFFRSFVESILFLFRIGRTNIPLPIPWFWNIDYSNLALFQSLNAFLIGLLFLILPLFSFGAIAYVAHMNQSRLSNNILLVASAFISLTYMHYAFSRSDVSHLAQAIHPMLLGLFALFVNLLRERKKELIVFLTVVLLETLLSIGLFQPFYIRAQSPEPYVKYEISDNTIWLHPKVVSLLNTIRKFTKETIGGKEVILVIPHFPAVYPILGIESPLRETFFLFPETYVRQKEMIQTLQEKQINWILVADIKLDNRDDLRFSKTHAVLWEYIQSNFKSVRIDGLPSNYEFMRRTF
jgi:hypothetical protein